MTQELIDYIKSELQKGTALEIITSTLAVKGWSVQDIQEAIAKIQQSTKSTSTSINNVLIETQKQNSSFLDIIYLRLVAIFFIIAPFISFVISAVTESQGINLDPVSNLSGLVTMIICIGIGIGLLLKKSAFWYIAIISLVSYLLLSLTILIPPIISKLVITRSFMEVVPSLIQIIIYSLVIVLLIKIKHIYIIPDPNPKVSTSTREKFKAALWGLGVGALPCILLTAIILDALGESRRSSDGMAGIAAAAVISAALFIFLILGLIILFFVVKGKRFKPAQILISFFTFLAILFAPLIIAYLITLTINTLTNPVYKAELVRETQTEYLKKKLSFEVLGEQIDSKNRTIDISLKIKNTSGKVLNIEISEVRLATPDTMNKIIKINGQANLVVAPFFADDVNLASSLMPEKKITFPQQNEQKFSISPGESILNFKLIMAYDQNGVSIYNPQLGKEKSDQVAKILASLSKVSVCGSFYIEGQWGNSQDYSHCSGYQYFGQTKPHDWVNLTY